MVMRQKQMQQVQDQLRQHLKSFRNINGLTAEQAAERLKVEIATYRTMEGKKPAPRLMSPLEKIEGLAALNKMKVPDFVNYLFRTPRTANNGKRWGWEEEFLEHFDQVGIPLINRLLGDLREVTTEELRDDLICFIRIMSMPKEKRVVLQNLVKKVMSDVPEDRDY